MSNIKDKTNLSTEKKRALLAQLLKKKASQPRHFPLSFSQERLWFLNQLEPGNAVYNIPSASRLTGSLNIKALRQSLNEIVVRHESLRTTFLLVDEQPVQIIAPKLKLELPVKDLRHLSETEREFEVQQIISIEVRQPFDLAQGPLLRSTLLQLGKAQYVLLLTVHHIVADGWSMEIFFRELSTLYAAFSIGEPSPLPKLSIQYADFATWQQERLQGNVLQAQLVYWKQQLTGVSPFLELPTDRPRPVVQSFRGARESFVLPKVLDESLKLLGKQAGVTSFITFLAVFQTLLYRYTGQDDIVVGSLIANRNRPEIEGLIGFFVNTLALRTNLSGNPTFQELLHRVRDMAMAAYAHQDLPFERLVGELRPDRDLSRTPFFQVALIFQNDPGQALTLPNLNVSSKLNLDRETAMFDLTLFVRDTADGMVGIIEYNADIFDATTITRMVGHFQTLLEAVVADPTQRLSTLPLLTPVESHQLLTEWNDTGTGYTFERSLSQLFETQVQQSPQATAFICGDQKLSYRVLNRQANQLAGYLQALGVGPDVTVGLCMERSLEMVVALLGLIKAGGVYLPLDPTYPQERLAFMVEDAQAQVILTQDRFVSILPEQKTQVLCLNKVHKIIAQHGEENPISKVTPEDLAYIIYTSGSTGQPKGVAVPHKQILNRFTWMWEHYPFEYGEVSCQKTALNFVDSIWELLGPLLQGSPTVIIPDEVVKDPAQFVDALAENGVTRLWVVPSLLRVMLNTFPNLQQRLPKLKFWVTSGEVILKELFQRFQEMMPQSVLYNLYGTSEVWDVTWYKPEQQHKEQPRVPIGYPISNMQTYILNTYLQPVPIGVPGELYVGGVGLAQGYINRPQLTKEKFIHNPFSPNPDARLYKTGDLARYLPDGNIEFLSRADFQVKVRGYRIELGEIEAILGEHPAVQEIVVIAKQDRSLAERRLVAYVVIASQKQGITNNDLRSFLKQKLPEHMIPSVFVRLNTLPLTPNGKLDRNALPKPDKTRPELETSYIVPKTQMEQSIATIWQDVLQIENVGLYDNFFDLGGHSLLMIQIQNKLHKVFEWDLSLVQLFQYPTVSGLAKHIVQGQQVQDSNTHKKISARAKARQQRRQRMRARRG